MPSRRGFLRDYFHAVGAKRLSAVEAHPERSNQHELNGVSPLREVFGSVVSQRFEDVRFFYWGEAAEPLAAEGFLTWYDARERHPTRSEYRLYFPTTSMSHEMAEGDLAIFARASDDTIFVIVCQGGSTAENQLRWLFGIGGAESGVQAQSVSAGQSVGFIEHQILSDLGLEAQQTEDPGYLDVMLDQWGDAFPVSREFSYFARSTLADVDPADDPDEALLAWLDQEELLFRLLEQHLVGKHLERGFENVESFMRYSLSVQNRRKSRAGLAVENHLEAIFDRLALRFSRGGVTEHRCRPDFLFPGEDSYHDPDFPSSALSMLGAKSTLKDRWRQVLSEAARIREKHLLTLEPGVSEAQTDEMRANALQLVIPARLHDTFTSTQQRWLFDLAAFIELLRTRERAWT